MFFAPPPNQSIAPQMCWLQQQYAAGKLYQGRFGPSIYAKNAFPVGAAPWTPPGKLYDAPANIIVK